ncbi:transmembrane protein 141 [Oratosquilla oratoria]|uniref:transmembrane protein 141 n=1 Tax=Oratosquilla oratoria TaxID=337810 RepID=UPI003F76F5FC
MNNTTEVINSYKEDYPAFQSYMECMSRTFMTGLASFTISFGGTYIGQHLLTKALPYSKGGHILASSVVASFVAYKVTAVRANACQAAWMAAEDKHTYLNPISERPKPVLEEEEE